MITDNPLHDWANHVNNMDRRPVEYDHVCESCNMGFVTGSQFDTEKFCKECVDGYRHVEFYENLEIPAQLIYEILNSEKKL